MSLLLNQLQKIFILLNIYYFTKNIFVISTSEFRPHFLGIEKINSFCRTTNFIPISVSIPIPIGQEKEILDNFILKKNKKTVSCNGRKPPLCSNCKHFIPFKTYFSFDKYKDEFGTGFGFCKMFGSKFDVIRYSFAKYCRENENQCGKNGFLYEENDCNNTNNNLIEELYEENNNSELKENKNSMNYVYVHSKEKPTMNLNSDQFDFEKLKNTNSQIYEYTRFLNSKDRHKKDI